MGIVVKSEPAVSLERLRHHKESGTQLPAADNPTGSLRRDPRAAVSAMGPRSGIPQTPVGGSRSEPVAG
jgi:hypothetical protein